MNAPDQPLILTVRPLTREAFAPFGDVIEVSDAVKHYPINAGNTMRYHDLAKVDVGADGRAIISIFRGEPRELPFRITMMERHPLGSQAFVPMSGRPYLLVVAAPSDTPRADALHAFLATAEQGVNYATGVWHHPLLALDGVSDFLIVDRAGPGHNCDEVDLDREAVILPLE